MFNRCSSTTWGYGTVLLDLVQVDDGQREYCHCCQQDEDWPSKRCTSVLARVSAQLLYILALIFLGLLIPYFVLDSITVSLLRCSHFLQILYVTKGDLYILGSIQHFSKSGIQMRQFLLQRNTCCFVCTNISQKFKAPKFQVYVLLQNSDFFFLNLKSFASKKKSWKLFVFFLFFCSIQFAQLFGTQYVSSPSKALFQANHAKSIQLIQDSSIKLELTD